MNKNIILLLPLLIIYSCSKDKFLAEIPSYLNIESINLETESYEGSDSHNITDVWVTMDGNFLGAFELPSLIPILSDGEHEFRISPGIKVNGISATRIIYPFYEISDLFMIDGGVYNIVNSNILCLYRDSIITINATTSYKDNLEFLFIEDFEDAGLIIDTSENSDTNLIKTNVRNTYI